MKYYVATDENNYVMLIKRTGTVKDYVDLDLSLYDLSEDRIYAYKLGQNELIFDQDRYNEILAERQAQANAEEIAQLKEYLNETDYVMARTFESIIITASSATSPNHFVEEMITICQEFYSQYSSVIQERIDARDRIEELEEGEVANG